MTQFWILAPSNDSEIIISSKRCGLYLLVLLSVLLVTILQVDFSATPFEDAAILMRYSENFAEGHGFVWNIGEKPVDGATDFLFTLIVGLLKKATGIAVPTVVYIVNIISHVISAMLVFIASWRLLRAPLFVSFVTTGFVVLGPGSVLISAQFGTPFFVLTASSLWFVSIRIMINKNPSKLDSLSFSILSLIVGLARPEGVFLSIFILCAVVYDLGLTSSLQIIKSYLIVMMLLGGSYFFWRWDYFGYPLPNPYYMKRSQFLDFGSLKDSIRFALRFTLPFLPLLILGLIDNPRTKKLFTIISPILGFTLIYSLIDGSMNFAGRFQYVIMFMIAMGWWFPLKGITLRDYNFPQHPSLPRLKWVMYISVIFYILGFYFFQAKYSSIKLYKDGRYNVGVILKDYRSQDLKVACSEAGLIPFYSKLQTLDTWGLNDQTIAHAGLISESILRGFGPDVIMFHGEYSLLTIPGTGTPHERMGIILKRYAELNDYELVANFGPDPFKSHFYYLRRGLLNFEEIKKRLKSIEYVWYENGRICLDFTGLKIAQ